MCGIYLTNHSISEEQIRQKLDRIQYRGPDYQGYAHTNSIQLGHNRLSIIDLDPRSHQPMQEEGYFLVFNGEIYNYLEVKKQLETEGVSFTTASDTEVLLKGYIAWGNKILEAVNGMFAFAIYDVNKHKVFVARDRLGVKPLYYSWEDGKLELSSQLLPMDTKGELNEDAIISYLQTGYIPSPLSVFKDIRKLSPGTFAVFDLTNKTIVKEHYWDLKKVIPKKTKYIEAKKELHQLLKDAVKIRLQSDVSHGCFLSGGIDSALIASLAQEHLERPLKTFTIGFNEKEYDESRVAKTFSDHLGTHHKEQICSPSDLLTLIDDFFKVYDEPFADSSAIPSLLLNKATKVHATVVLSGDGGDESFLGYNHFDWVNKMMWVFRIPYILRKIIQKIIPFRIFGKRGDSFRNILGYHSIITFIKHIFTGFDTIALTDNFQWFYPYKKYLNLAVHPLQRAADLNLRLWLENDSNVKVDRASMAYSVEVRSPFLDYRVVEFARSLPVHFRFSKQGKRKLILRDILQEYIPEPLFDQPKKGFAIPLGKWIREDLKSEMLTYLSKEKLEKIPNLNKNKVNTLLEKHLAQKADYSLYIWRVYVLSRWIDINLKMK
jgi:asparagine synthase (glutamine-hydrolysing)